MTNTNPDHKNDIYITIVRNGYFPARVGDFIVLTKEPDNTYDYEAIAAHIFDDVDPSDSDSVIYTFDEPEAYVANSVRTVAHGTHSAGRLYDKFDSVAKAKVCFIIDGKAICKFLGELPDKPHNQSLPETA